MQEQSQQKVKKGDMYVVVQVVLTEKFIGTGSGVSSLTNLQRTINEQAAKGYVSVATTYGVRILKSDFVKKFV